MREFLYLHRDTKGATGYLEAALQRVEEFTRWAGGDPQAVVNNVWKLYAERSPALGFFVLLDDLDGIVGHVLVDVRGWDGHQVAWVNQLKMDVGHPELSEAEIAMCIARLDAWLMHWNEHVLGLKRSDLIAREYLFSTPRDTEAWARAFGFQPHRALRRRALPAS